MSAHASSICGRTPLAILAVMEMPASVTLAEITCPIGWCDMCCQSSGSGRVKTAPFGSTMSPMRSVDGVLAMPSMIRWSSSTDFISKVE